METVNYEIEEETLVDSVMLENPYLQRFLDAWEYLTPWQQKKLYIRVMYWVMLDKVKTRLLTIWKIVLKST